MEISLESTKQTKPTGYAGVSDLTRKKRPGWQADFIRRNFDLLSHLVSLGYVSVKYEREPARLSRKFIFITQRRKIMTKLDLIDAIVESTGLSKYDAGKFVDAFVESVCQTLGSGDKVSLAGFGTFSVGERSARTGRNPQTGDPVEIAAAKVPKFKPAKGLKDSLN